MEINILGPQNVVRIDPAVAGTPIELDDYRRAMNELLPAVAPAAAAHRDRVKSMFLADRVDAFVPLPS